MAACTYTYQCSGIYNVLDFTSNNKHWTANDNPAADPNTPANNKLILAAAVAAAQANDPKGQGLGGIVLVPCVDLQGYGGPFYLAGAAVPIDTSNSAPSIAIIGYGGQTTLVQQDDNVIFKFSTTSTDPTKQNAEGHIIENLTLKLLVSLTTATSAAITLSNAPNILVRRVWIEDYPQCVNISDSLQARVKECTLKYTSGYGNTKGSSAVLITGTGGPGSGSEQATIESCLFSCDTTLSQLMSATIVGIVIQEAAHGRFTDIDINGFSVGILFNPIAAGGGSKYHTFTGVHVNPPSNNTASPPQVCAVKINPQNTQGQTNAGPVLFIKFVGCSFACNAATTDTVVGVYIDENDAGGGKIDAVEFAACSFDGFAGPGLWITSGASRTQVTGCIFENNNKNTSQGSGLPVGQISIIGQGSSANSPSGVNVSGATCSNSNKYAITIENAAANVFVSNCNLGTNPAAAINFSNPGSAVTVTGCSAYNDQKTTVRTGPPISTSTQSAALNGYYGPSLVTCHLGATGITLTVNGTAFTVAANSFFSLFLNSPYDTILFSSIPVNTFFTWTGE